MNGVMVHYYEKEVLIKSLVLDLCEVDLLFKVSKFKMLDAFYLLENVQYDLEKNSYLVNLIKDQSN